MTTHQIGRRSRLLFMAAGATLTLGLAACSADSGGADSESEATKDSYSIGVLSLAQASLLDDIIEAFEAAVVEGVGDAEVSFDVQNANGDQSLVNSISRDFAGSDHDAFAVIGTPAVIALAQQITDRPVFALAMGDPVGAGVAESLEEPGGNVTGSIDYVDPASLVDDILEIHPDAASIGTVYDPSNQNLQVWVADLKKALEGTDVELVESTVASTAEVAQASRSLVGRSDVVLVGPDANVIAGLDALGAAMAGDGIPTYLAGGDPMFPGILASIGPDYPSLGTSAGENAALVLLGQDPAVTPFTTPDALEFVVNPETEEALGVEFPASIEERIVR